jgi:hypothetical protein
MEQLFSGGGERETGKYFPRPPEECFPEVARCLELFSKNCLQFRRDEHESQSMND